MKIHELKTLPEYYNEVKSGRKTFEARLDDRGFEVGDILQLDLYHPATGYAGVFIERVVTYKLSGPAYGIEEGHCVMAIKPTKAKTL